MSERNPFIPHDTEDRGWWYIHGERLELRFVELCNNKLHLEARINPEKTINKMAPDLIVGGKLADLKTQNTPFFTSARYKLDPRYTITFNRKDYERYKKLYPDIVIYFWVDWTQTQWKGNTIEYFGGFFSIPFPELAALIESGAPEHHYINRMSPGDLNAKSSFLLDVRRFTNLFSSDVKPQ